MRTKHATVRELVPDTKYGSVLVARLINYVMKDGKKSVAVRQVYQALETIQKQTNSDPVEILAEVVDIISPQMEVRSRRVGGAAYQVPMPVRPRRATALALRWLISEASKRSSKQYHTFYEKLVAEMMDALAQTGGAVQKKIGAHKMAEANKAFAHFRW